MQAKRSPEFREINDRTLEKDLGTADATLKRAEARKKAGDSTGKEIAKKADTSAETPIPLAARASNTKYEDLAELVAAMPDKNAAAKEIKIFMFEKIVARTQAQGIDLNGSSKLEFNKILKEESKNLEKALTERGDLTDADKAQYKAVGESIANEFLKSTMTPRQYMADVLSKMSAGEIARGRRTAC